MESIIPIMAAAYVFNRVTGSTMVPQGSYPPPHQRPSHGPEFDNASLMMNQNAEMLAQDQDMVPVYREMVLAPRHQYEQTSGLWSGFSSVHEDTWVFLGMFLIGILVGYMVSWLMIRYRKPAHNDISMD